MQKGFYIDLSRCTACDTCTTACMSWHDLEVGMRWIQVVELESGEYPNVSVARIPIPCFHCGDPRCMHACPVDAITKRLEDGIVVVDPDKCIGCRQCFIACPFGAPQFGSDGRMQKCNFCLDRTTQGLDPVCVAACPTRALYAGTMKEIEEIASQKAAKRLAGAAVDKGFLSPELWGVKGGV